MSNEERYDVVIVGASLAGCTAATFLGRSGLRVALVERSRDLDAYKAMCGHWILGGTKATLDRLGLWESMIDAGAFAGWPSVWSDAGWIEPQRDAVPPSISLRRAKLDPLVRRMAAATDGVELMLGCSVTELATDHTGRVVGVRAGDRLLTARLVVGADGHRSTVARLAGVAESPAPNERFFWWAYYRGLDVATSTGVQIWAPDPDAAVVTPAGDGLHLVGVFPTKGHLPAFADDRVAAIERRIAPLPDAPDLRAAERVSNAVGTSDYPFVRRDPLPRPGLALIGDAAMASDPAPAVGCGWAFRTAEWLADAATPGLRGEEDLDQGLERYREARAVVEQYDELARGEAAAPAPNGMARAVRRAAYHDADIARRLGLFAARAAAPDILLNPEVAQRALALVSA